MNQRIAFIRAEVFKYHVFFVFSKVEGVWTADNNNKQQQQFICTVLYKKKITNWIKRIYKWLGTRNIYES